MPMRFKTGNIDVEVSIDAIGNELLLREPKIRYRTVDGKLVQKVRMVAKRKFVWKGKDCSVDVKLTDPETHEEVPLSEAKEVLENYVNEYIDETGESQKEEDLLWMDVQDDGTEVPFTPFERNKAIEIKEENWVPSVSVEPYLVKPENIYEIYSANKVGTSLLQGEAEKRYKADQVGITTFVYMRGTKQYYAFVMPYFTGGKFVWLMKVSITKPEYRHLQEPVEAVKVPIREAPTLQTLPPVQALVVTAKKRKSENQ